MTPIAPILMGMHVREEKMFIIVIFGDGPWLIYFIISTYTCMSSTHDIVR